MSISTKAHAQLSNEHGTETHLKVPKEGTDKSIVINIEIATRKDLSWLDKRNLSLLDSLLFFSNSHLS